MNIDEYKELEDELLSKHRFELHKLRSDYVANNKKYSIGDFVYNVTGIIRVDSVGYRLFLGGIEIVYTGYRYKKQNGQISRTKDKLMATLWESHKLKLLTIS